MTHKMWKIFRVFFPRFVPGNFWLHRIETTVNEFRLFLAKRKIFEYL